MQPTLRHTPQYCQRSTSDLQSQVRGAETGGVATGTGAEHEQLRGAAETLWALAAP
jgi:hypothetical protein